MPCYRCGARQVDPEQGKSSPWKRGVRREHQVLICPDCAADAVGELDRCAGCGGTQLIRRLDQVECLACGQVREVGPEPGDPLPDAPAPDAQGPGSVEPGARVRGAPAPGTLADEVASALDRVLRRR